MIDFFLIWFYVLLNSPISGKYSAFINNLQYFEQQKNPMLAYFQSIKIDLKLFGLRTNKY